MQVNCESVARGGFIVWKGRSGVVVIRFRKKYNFFVYFSCRKLGMCEFDRVLGGTAGRRNFRCGGLHLFSP